MVIEHNMASMNAQRQVNSTTRRFEKSSEKLASGYKINRSADDAAGLEISNKMRWQIRGLNRGADNIEDGKSLVDVADGALEEIHSILQRMNELSVQAANDTNTNEDRTALQDEIDQLNAEIDRIGKDTTFNDMHILDDAFGDNLTGSLTKLVHCKAADTGYLTESVYSSATQRYYASANLDFSGINSRNIKKLDGKGFSFTCSQSCGEVFEFKFTMGGGNHVDNQYGTTTHKYTVDIKGCTNGTQVVKRLYDAIMDAPPGRSPGHTYTPTNILPQSVTVSHSNDLAIDGDKLIVFKNSDGQSTAAAAEAMYANRVGTNNPYAAIDASELTKVVHDELINEFYIQCSSSVGDYQLLTTHRIKSELLGVDKVDVTGQQSASQAITKVQAAIDMISEYRSELGAYTNRLEKSFNNANNSAENVQKAESQLADTDMAEEMMKYSKEKILLDAGNTILAQANSSKDGVLQLLQ